MAWVTRQEVIAKPQTYICDIKQFWGVDLVKPVFLMGRIEMELLREWTSVELGFTPPFLWVSLLIYSGLFPPHHWKVITILSHKKFCCNKDRRGYDGLPTPIPSFDIKVLFTLSLLKTWNRMKMLVIMERKEWLPWWMVVQTVEQEETCKGPAGI